MTFLPRSDKIFPQSNNFPNFKFGNLSGVGCSKETKLTYYLFAPLSDVNNCSVDHGSIFLEALADHAQNHVQPVNRCQSSYGQRKNAKIKFSSFKCRVLPFENRQFSNPIFIYSEMPKSERFRISDRQLVFGSNFVGTSESEHVVI